MDYADVTQSAFLDELEKISFSKGKFLRGALSSRKGRRPMRVSTMLKKEKGGELFKYTKSAEGSAGNIVPYSDTDYQSSTGANGPTGKPAEIPKGPNDQPSREDGRDQMSVKVTGPGRTELAPAATNNPAEHGTY